MGRQREGAEMGSRRGNGKEMIAAGEPFPDGRVRTPATEARTGIRNECRPTNGRYRAQSERESGIAKHLDDILALLCVLVRPLCRVCFPGRDVWLRRRLI